jgi:hypothetical protein
MNEIQKEDKKMKYFLDSGFNQSRGYDRPG